MPIEPVIGTAPGSWTVIFPPETRVIDLAVIMAGIGCRVAATFVGDGFVELRPLDHGEPCPTAVQLRDIMAHGVLPMQSQRMLVLRRPYIA